MRGELDLDWIFVDFDDPIEKRLQKLHGQFAKDEDGSYDCEEHHYFDMAEERKSNCNVSNRAITMMSHSGEKDEDYMKSKIEGTAVFIDSFGRRDSQFIKKMIKRNYPEAYKDINSVSHKLKNLHSSIEIKPSNTFIVRLWNGKCFTELATFNYKLFQDWKSIFKHLCLQNNFNTHYSIQKLIKDFDLSKV